MAAEVELNQFYLAADQCVYEDGVSVMVVYDSAAAKDDAAASDNVAAAADVGDDTIIQYVTQ